MAALDLIIRAALVIGPEEAKRQDVGIHEGRFVLLQDHISEKANRVIAANGLALMAGLIDTHVHFNEPGRSTWEGLASGSAALAAGGGSLFCDMPLNSTPPVLDYASYQTKRALAEQKSFTDFALWGGLTANNLNHLEELAEAGAIGFKAFMSDSGIEDFKAVDDDSLYTGMQQAAKLGLPVAVHAEHQPLIDARQQEARARDAKTARDYCETRPIEAELKAIQRALLIAAATNCDLHIVHVSSAQGVALIQEAKLQGVRVTAETCPHYLFFNQTDMERQGAVLKCAPPLRPEAERQALLMALQQGHLDTLGSDHSPASLELKEAEDFFAIWGGIAAVQSSLPAMLQLQVAPSQLTKLFSLQPAQRFRLANKGRIAPGYDADFCLLDLKHQERLHIDSLLSRHRFSPYLKHTLTGAVKQTFLRGQCIMQDGSIVGSAGGKHMRPTNTTH